MRGALAPILMIIQSVLFHVVRGGQTGLFPVPQFHAYAPENHLESRDNRDSRLITAEPPAEATRESEDPHEIRPALKGEDLNRVIHRVNFLLIHFVQETEMRVHLLLLNDGGYIHFSFLAHVLPGKEKERETILAFPGNLHGIDAFDGDRITDPLSPVKQHTRTVVLETKPPESDLLVGAVFARPLIRIEFLVEFSRETNVDVYKRKARSRIDDRFRAIDHAVTAFKPVDHSYHDGAEVEDGISHVILELFSHHQHPACIPG